MIEQNIDPRTFLPEQNPMKILKWGMLMLGMGIGSVMGNWVWFTFDMHPAAAFPSMIFIFGGLFLVIFYLIQMNIAKKK